MFKRFSAVLVVVVMLFAAKVVPSHAAEVSAFGQATLVTYNYGSGGLVNNIQIYVLDLDMSGEFLYVCRRPNLGPCTAVMPGLNYHFQANLTSICYVPGKICGEGLISSISPL